MLMKLFLVMGIAAMSMSDAGSMSWGAVSHVAAAEISGTWSAMFTISNQSVPVVLNFAEKDGLVTGTVQSNHTGPGTISEGTWKNNSINCILKFKKHESIALAGTLKEEVLGGEFKTEGMAGTWVAKRD